MKHTSRKPWRNKLRIQIPLVGALVVSACTSGGGSTPAAQTSGASANAGSGSDCQTEASLEGYDSCQIPRTIFKARGQVLAFRSKYERSANREILEQTSFDSALIAVATAGVVAAFSKVPTLTVGLIGLGGGSLGLFRSYYDPQGQLQTYLNAKKALNCVLDQSAILLAAQPSALSEAERSQAAVGPAPPSPNNDAQQDATTKDAETEKGGADANSAGLAAAAVLSEQTEKNAASKLSESSSKLSDASAEASAATAASTAPVSASIAQRSADNAQQSATATAVGAAKSASDTVDTELAAYVQSPSIIWSTLDKIISYVDTNTVRSAQSTANLQSSLTVSITQQATSVAGVAAARTQLMSAVSQQSTAKAEQSAATPAATPAAAAAASQATDNLNAQTSMALSDLPNPLYSAVNTNIQACAAGL